MLRNGLPVWALALMTAWTFSNGEAQAQERRKTAIETIYPSQFKEPPTPRADFRIAHDAWFGQDKYVDHGFGSFALAAIADRVTHAESGAAEGRVFLWAGAFWLGNEVKDAILPWEKVGWIGGDGFSIKDLIWSVAGTGLALIVF